MQAVIRGDYPALIPTVGIICGEACANLGLFSVIACLITTFFALKNPALKALTLSFLIGIGLATQLTNTINYAELLDQHSYLVRITSLPRYRVPGSVELDLIPIARIDTQPSYRFSKLDQSQEISCRAIELPWRNISKLSSGQIFIARLKINPLTPNESSPYRQALWRHGYAATCEITHSTKALSPETYTDQARSILAQRVRQHLGDNQTSGLLLGMALGMRDGITNHLEQAFKNTGLAHLLVLSGYQVTLVAFGVRSITRRTLLIFSTDGTYLLLADLFGLVAAIVLTVFTGLEAAALRAVVALLIAVHAIRNNRRATLGGITLATLLVTTATFPTTPFDLSSLLTFGALLGITLGAARPAKLKAASYALVLLYCSLTTSLLCTIYFKTFCPAAFIFNAIFAPLLSTISCNIGIPAILLVLANCPLGASIMICSANIIQFCADLIQYLGNSPLAAWQLDRGSSVMVASFIALPLMHRFSRCLEYYLLSRGIYPHQQATSY